MHLPFREYVCFFAGRPAKGHFALWFLGFCFLLSQWMVACQSPSPTSSRPLVVTTTGMIADLLKNIAGDDFEVKALMGPGVDPHLYKATRQDLADLRRAEVVFYNGLHLEGKMAEVLEKLENKHAVFALAKGIAPQKIHKQGGAPDPHIWFDVQLWEEASVFVAQKMAEKYPRKAAVFQKNQKEYQAKLRQLDEELRQSLRQIPQTQRVLITAHDAFGYFGQAYNMEVKGLQGISTLSEFGLRDVKELVDFIVARKIKAVFVESAISPKSLEAVVQGCAQRGHTVRIGGTLYADALGGADTPAGTYLGMVRTNLRTIIEALQ